MAKLKKPQGSQYLIFVTPKKKDTMQVKIKRVNEEFKDLELPHYKTHGSAGMDVMAAINDDLTIRPGEIQLVPTGIAIAIPEGYECQVRSRSGLSLKHGIFCLNSPGTIDSDYRGEVKVILANFSREDFVVKRGERIAQLVIAQYTQIHWHEVEELDDTERGDGGFGSTGK